MATITLTALATQAAGDLGGIDPNEGLTSFQISQSLILANQMLASWSIDQRFIPSVLVTLAQALTSGVQVYTIGTGATVNIVRPNAIISANADVTTAASTAYAATGDPQYAPAAAGSKMISPLKILTAAEWNSLPMRDVAKVFPRALFYDRANSAGVGKLYFDNQLGGTFDLTTWSVITGFADATTPLAVPDPAYLELMQYGLAVRQVNIFPGIVIPDFVKELYTDAENRVKTLNAQLVGAQGMQPAAGEPPAAEAA